MPNGWTIKHNVWAILLLNVCLLAGCGATPQQSSASTQAQATQVLRLATTTSTQDSGLLDAILPDFERQTGVDVQVIAVGTGQALKIAASGDADVVLVHARKREDEFVNAGDGIDRRDVMYNDFVVVGPRSDSAGVQSQASAKDAFKAIAAAEAAFAARGDDSGTAAKELSIWNSVGITPTAELSWYRSLGQGMGETLITANEQQAYALTDRATYLAMHDKLPNLTLLFGGATLKENNDPNLLNPYGVIRVNPEKHPNVQADLAKQFVDWLVSAETQAKINQFGQDTFGQPLFMAGKAP